MDTYPKEFMDLQRKTNEELAGEFRALLVIFKLLINIFLLIVTSYIKIIS